MNVEAASDEKQSKAKRAYCNVCGHETTWAKKRGGKREVCGGCQGIFPCAHACRHWDCMEVRGEAVADELGVLRLVKTEA
jgi:hypothetical protein